jgi:hypothetical protein
MFSGVFSTIVRSRNTHVPSTKKEERKMSGTTGTFARKAGLLLSLFVTTFSIIFCAEAFAQLGGVDADICWIREAGFGPVIDISTAPAPCPNLEDGLARSSTHYFYTTNGGRDDTVYKIDLAGVTVDSALFVGANFQGLAYVLNAGGGGIDRLYGLDEIGNQMVEFDPVAMVPTGVTIPIAPGIGRNACSGGNGVLFVQVENAGFVIWRYNTVSGIWGPNFPTPMGGTVLFDGLSFRGGVHVGTEVNGAGSDIWRYTYPGPWMHIGGGYPTLPFRMSAMGAHP